MPNIISLLHNFDIKLFTIMKKRNVALIIFGIITLIIQGIIISESFANGQISSNHSSGFTQMIIDWVGDINPEAYIYTHQEEFRAFARKLFGHFLLFGGLGFFSMLSLSCLEGAYKEKKVEIVVTCMSFGLGNAIFSELIQTFIPGRSGEIKDVLIDFSGFILFSLIIFVILLIINNIQEKKKNVSTLG